MGRTFALFAVALASLAAAAMAALLRPAAPKPADPRPIPVATAAAPGLRMRAVLERQYLPTDRDTNAYLEVDLVADADPAAGRRRVPVNAVLILDRSGSMSGVKIDRAREAARALVRALVARDVRVRVTGLSGASLDRVLGYEPDAGWVRVPDFAAGEERRVLVKLTIPPGRGVADVAAVELTFAGATGERRTARAVAQATFTSDASSLAQAPTQAAAAGASAEMAELAQQAALLQEKGDRREARARLDAVKRVAAQVARVAPASAAEIARAAIEYERGVDAIDAPGGVASKKLKARAFDQVRAPVAGW